MRATATNVEINKFALKAEDVIITKDSETSEDIANAATVVEDLPGVVCGYHLAILRPHPGVSGFYMGQLLMFSRIRYQFSRIANGATRFGLNLSSTRKIPLWLPSYDEQVKIAKVLMKIDHQIDALLLLLNQLKEQKRGLMQKLLTGQIRVKATEESIA
jgi:type I restriction enzyme S subunit